MKKLIIYYTIAFWGLTTVLSGQDTIALPSDNVEVLKNYEAIIQQAEKQNLEVEFREKEFAPVQFTYSKQKPKAIEFDRPEPEIRALALKIKDSRPEDVKDGRVYGAFGSRQTIQGGAAYHYYIEDWLEAGINYDHFSAKDQELAYQKYNIHKANIYGGYYLGDYTKARLDLYGETNKHFTGIPELPDSILSEQDQLKYGAAMDFSHTAFKNAGIVLRSRLSWDHYEQQSDNVSENVLTAAANIYKEITDQVHLEVPVSYRYISVTRRDVESSDQNDISVSPTVRVVDNLFHGKIGIMYNHAGTKNYFSALLDIYMPGLTDVILLRAFAEADFDRNRASRLAHINPFYHTIQADYSPYLKRTYGISGEKEYGNLVAALSMSYNRYTNVHNFRFESSTRRFDAEFPDRSEFDIRLDMLYKAHDLVSLEGSLTRRNFLGDSITVNYIPNWEYALGFKISSLDKRLETSACYRGLGSRTTGSSDPSIPGELPSYSSLDASFTLRINEVFEIFGHGLNLLGNKENVLWPGHPVFTTQVWGGIRINI